MPQLSNTDLRTSRKKKRPLQLEQPEGRSPTVIEVNPSAEMKVDSALMVPMQNTKSKNESTEQEKPKEKSKKSKREGNRDALRDQIAANRQENSQPEVSRMWLLILHVSSFINLILSIRLSTPCSYIPLSLLNDDRCTHGN